MSVLSDILGQALGGGTLGQISREIGADEGATENAMSAALPMLLGALTRNASRGNGAQDLLDAVSRDHDGSILDNVEGYLSKAESGPGDGILRHVLGARQPAVEKGLSRTSGLDAGSVGKMLTILAPIVMGTLGKAQRRGSMDAKGLVNMLNQESNEVGRREPRATGLVSQLLDTDGDGDVDLSDLAKHGFGMLGKMFRG